MRDYLRIDFDRAPIAATGPGWVATGIRHLTAYPARWRLDHDVYKFPIEVWINRTMKNLVKLPKPNVDAKMMGPETAPSCT